jgi:hypothetical protein
MDKEINVYCDESNHLEKDSKPMVLGALSCPRNKAQTVNKRIREIKNEHNIHENFEIKWTKVSSKHLPFYIDVLNYFFDITEIGIRVVVANKENLNHEKYSQTHDDWYYKIYFQLLTKVISSENEYRICLDRKDTLGRERVQRLRDILCNKEYDFNRKIIKEIREVHSVQVQMVQVIDLIIGAIQFNLCSDAPNESEAKRAIVDHIKKKTGKSLKVKTLPSEFKFNLFFWDGAK